MAEACRLAGKSDKTYDYYRNSDEAFRNEVKQIRGQIAGTGVRPEVPDFPTFCKEYLG